MFGIGGGEFIFIIFIILMFFGSDKIPEIARTVGKGIAQLKNATNDINSEIQGSGIDVNSLTGGISEEISKAKDGFTKMVTESNDATGMKSELDQIRENFTKMNSDLNPVPGAERVSELSTYTELPVKDVVEKPEITEKEDVQGPIKRQR